MVCSAAWPGFVLLLPLPPAQPRAVANEPSSFTFAGRTIDFDSLQLTTPDKTIRLTLMECDLLRYLVQNQGRIISRKELLEQVWRVREDTDTRAIDNFMVRLRRYIEDNPAEPVFLETVRGIGYRFLPDVSCPDGTLASTSAAWNEGRRSSTFSPLPGHCAPRGRLQTSSMLSLLWVRR